MACLEHRIYKGNLIFKIQEIVPCTIPPCSRKCACMKLTNFKTSNTRPKMSTSQFSHHTYTTKFNFSCSSLCSTSNLPLVLVKDKPVSLFNEAIFLFYLLIFYQQIKCPEFFPIFIKSVFTFSTSSFQISFFLITNYCLTSFRNLQYSPHKSSRPLTTFL